MKSFLSSYSMTVGPNFIIRCNQQPNAISPPEHLSYRKIREYVTLSFALCCCPILLSFVLAVVWTSPTLAPIANSLFLSISIYRSCVSHTSIVVCHASARDEHPINKIKLARRLFTNTSAIYITDWAIYTSNIVQHEYTKTESAEIDCVVRQGNRNVKQMTKPNRNTHTIGENILTMTFFWFFLLALYILQPKTKSAQWIARWYSSNTSTANRIHRFERNGSDSCFRYSDFTHITSPLTLTWNVLNPKLAIPYNAIIVQLDRQICYRRCSNTLRFAPNKNSHMIDWRVQQNDFHWTSCICVCVCFYYYYFFLLIHLLLLCCVLCTVLFWRVRSPCATCNKISWLCMCVLLVHRCAHCCGDFCECVCMR